MATVKRFEELQVWQMADAQCAAFYDLVKEGRLRGHAPLHDQMDRSSASVMDNIAEGFDRYTKADFRHFLVIARGSNAEFRSQLYRAASRAVIEKDKFEALKKVSEHLGVKLHHFINYLSGVPYEHKTHDSKWHGKNDNEPTPSSSQILEPSTLYNIEKPDPELPAFTYNLPDEFIVPK